MALRGRAWVGVCAVAVAAGLLGIQPAGRAGSGRADL